MIMTHVNQRNYLQWSRIWVFLAASPNLPCQSSKRKCQFQTKNYQLIKRGFPFIIQSEQCLQHVWLYNPWQALTSMQSWPPLVFSRLCREWLICTVWNLWRICFCSEIVFSTSWTPRWAPSSSPLLSPPAPLPTPPMAKGFTQKYSTNPKGKKH